MWVTNNAGYSVAELAQKKGASMAQISLAWTMSKDGELQIQDILKGDWTLTLAVCSCICADHWHYIARQIEGSYRCVFLRRVMELRSGLITHAGALEVHLTPEDIAYLEEPYKPLAVFGHV
jgi:hypothetical protein